MSNFTDVAHLNNLIGNAQGDPENIDWGALAHQFHLIKEEFEELAEALENRDLTAVRDGAGDTLVTTYGLLHRAGINADADMAEIHRSNMSKFCHSSQEALDTGAAYERKGISVSYRNISEGVIAVRSAEDQTDTEGKSFPKGKLLKSVNFKEPVFSE